MTEPDTASIRHQLGILCRRKGCRTSAWTPDCPTDWRPTSVANPDTGEPFTEAGAWEWVADQLDAGIVIEPVSLDKPPGKTAFAFQVTKGAIRIYVKLQLGSGKVIGRSFHRSEPFDKKDPRRHKTTEESGDE